MLVLTVVILYASGGGGGKYGVEVRVGFGVRGESLGASPAPFVCAAVSAPGKSQVLPGHIKILKSVHHADR